MIDNLIRPSTILFNCLALYFVGIRRCRDIVYLFKNHIQQIKKAAAATATYCKKKKVTKGEKKKLNNI